MSFETTKFQQSLCKFLNELFHDELGFNDLYAETEHRKFLGDELNKIDIGIISKKKENSIISVEIEINNNFDQIWTNYSKFKNWVHKSNGRIGGLLHIINGDTHFHEYKMSDLLKASYKDILKNNGFFYELFPLHIADKRISNHTIAQEIINNWEFRARLYTLLHFVFGKRI